LKHESGAYVGTWGSNVDFNDDNEATLELDLYGGYASNIGPVGYNVGAIYYAYPGADSDLDYNFFEIFGKADYDWKRFSVGGGIYLSRDYFGGTGDSNFYFAEASTQVYPGITALAHIGQQDIQDGENYAEWKLGLAGEYAGFGVEVAYHDTDLDSQLADDRIVLGISRSF
jgi:uncharacterized protein (TIGR02001 family)